MTAVSPMTTQMSDFIDCGDKQQATDNNADIENNIVEGKIQTQDSSLMRSASSLLNPMRVTGQYFKWPFGKNKSGTASSVKSSTTRCRKSIELISFVYSTIALVLLWTNAIRLLTVFTAADQMGIILTKFMFVSFHFQVAIQQSSYYFACVSGTLDRVLTEIRLESPVNQLYIHRLAVCGTITIYSITILSGVTQTYAIFFTKIDDFLHLAAPIETYIVVPNVVPALVVSDVIIICVAFSVSISISMTFTLMIAFALEFRTVNRKLRKAIKNGTGIDDDSLENIRQDHERLCHLVEKADRFLRVFIGAGFASPLISIVIALYLVSQRAITNGSQELTYYFAVWLSASVNELVITSLGALLVNYYVSIEVFSIVKPCEIV